MHEGAVSAALGLAGVPASPRVDDDRPRRALAGYEDARIHVQHLSASQSVEAVAAAKAARRADHQRGHAASPRPDRRGGPRRLDASFKMNPPLRTEDDRQALIEALRDGTIDCIATDHAPHAARREGGAVRAGDDGRDRARDRVRRSSTRNSSCPACCRSRPDRREAGLRRRAVRPRPRRASPRARPANLVPRRPRRRVGRSARTATRAARPTPGAPAASCTGRVLMTLAAGAVAFRRARLHA